MKKSFPGRIHTFILPYLVLLALIFPSPISAACNPGVCTGSGSPCQVTSGTSKVSYCCTGTNTASQCSALKGGNSASSGSGGGSGFKPQECNGGTGIDTALGCIPFKTDGFSQALLTFLAGTAGAIALVIMLIATIQIMTGGDNAEQVKKGKELFTGAVTGLLFIIFSVTLLRIVAGDIIKLPGFQ